MRGDGDRVVPAGWVAEYRKWGIVMALCDDPPLFRARPGKWALFWLMANHMIAAEKTGHQDVVARFRNGSVLWTPAAQVPKCL